MSPQSTRLCTKCKQHKPLSQFWPDRSKAAGYMACCKSCRSAVQREYRARNPEMHKERYRKNRDKERERHLVRKYGVTFADYARMLAEQHGCCAICSRPEPPDRMLDVDHDHKTGDVRGLLCTSCNRMIGHAHDSDERLRRAAEYLRSSRKSPRSSSARSSKSKPRKEAA